MQKEGFFLHNVGQSLYVSQPQTGHPEIRSLVTIAILGLSNSTNSSLVRETVQLQWGYTQPSTSKKTMFLFHFHNDNPSPRAIHHFLLLVSSSSILHVCSATPSTGSSSSAPGSGPNVFYVAPNTGSPSPAGSDANPGSLQAPFATLQHCFNRLSQLAPAEQPGSACLLRGGVYTFPRWARLSNLWGTTTHPVVIGAALGADGEPEPVVVDGTVGVGGGTWTWHGSGGGAGGCPGASGGCWSADWVSP